MSKVNSISVCLCTYNGERYIEEQLRSILNQTLSVDEICVGDDCSTDNTIEIIERVRRETGANIKIEKNETNLRCNSNFNLTMSRCAGDIILFSDQDDYWMPDKVKTIVDYFESNQNIDVVFTNGEFMDEEGKSFTNAKMFDAVAFTPSTIKQFYTTGLQLEAFIVNNRATGATMAMRRSFIGQFYISNVENSNGRVIFWDHILALAAVSQGKIGIIDKPLIRYRIHSGQTIGFGKWIYSPPVTSDLYVVGYGLDYCDLVPYDLRERAKMVTDRYYYKKSKLYNNLFRYFYRYIKIYGYAMGVRVWSHDLINAITGKPDLDF